MGVSGGLLRRSGSGVVVRLDWLRVNAVPGFPRRSKTKRPDKGRDCSRLLHPALFPLPVWGGYRIRIVLTCLLQFFGALYGGDAALVEVDDDSPREPLGDYSRLHLIGSDLFLVDHSMNLPSKRLNLLQVCACPCRILIFRSSISSRICSSVFLWSSSMTRTIAE